MSGSYITDAKIVWNMESAIRGDPVVHDVADGVVVVALAEHDFAGVRRYRELRDRSWYQMVLATDWPLDPSKYCRSLPTVAENRRVENPIVRSHWFPEGPEDFIRRRARPRGRIRIRQFAVANLDAADVGISHIIAVAVRNEEDGVLEGAAGLMEARLDPILLFDAVDELVMTGGVAARPRPRRSDARRPGGRPFADIST